MKDFRVIAFTHRNTPLDQVGKFHIDESLRNSKLSLVSESLNLQELVFISTCNRVEFVFKCSEQLNDAFVEKFLSTLYPEFSREVIAGSVEQAQQFSGISAAEHLFRVASSLDSLVVGEREILTQVRTSFEQCLATGHAGDSMRLLLKNIVSTAKEVYTNTSISHNPVSVVSLAYRELRKMNIPLDARILIVGAGVTNANLSKYLQKHGFRNFTVFNRSIERAEELAANLHGEAYSLSTISEYKKGFDVLVSCTAAADHIITPELYARLTENDDSLKVVIDLAIPYDVDPAVYRNFNCHPILVESLKQAAEENLLLRREALHDCEHIIAQHLEEFREMYHTRRVEKAMQEVPVKIREIHDTALNKVFAREIENLDAGSRETLEKMMQYLEKKYISVPMKMAKEILLEKH
ncbi:MAG: glutamyl-tRNA reductase [Bacteroidia bacterium]